MRDIMAKEEGRNSTAARKRPGEVSERSRKICEIRGEKVCETAVIRADSARLVNKASERRRK